MDKILHYIEEINIQMEKLNEKQKTEVLYELLRVAKSLAHGVAHS